ncbi:MAG: redox-sensing transcriptional repressor Rex [Armatimonadota bacterium]
MACPVRGHFEKKRCYTRKLATHFQEWQATRSEGERRSKVSEKTITRLRQYLYAIDDYISQGMDRVSSEDISRKVGVKDYLIRSDFSQFGEFGRPSIGYDTTALRTQLQRILHLDVAKNMVWIGALHLAAEPSLIQHFERNSFKIVSVLDRDPSKFAGGIGNLQVLPLEQAAQTIAENEVGGAILSVAPEDAQPIADILIEAGIKGILNLSSAVIATPPTVCVRHLDILGELFALSYYCHQAHSG